MTMHPNIFTIEKLPLVDRFRCDFTRTLEFYLNMQGLQPQREKLLMSQIDIILPHYLTEVYFNNLPELKGNESFIKFVEWTHRMIAAFGIDPDTPIQLAGQAEIVTEPLYKLVYENMLTLGEHYPYMVGNQPFSVIGENLPEFQLQIIGDYLYVKSDVSRIIQRLKQLEGRVNKLEEENAKYRQMVGKVTDFFTGEVML